MKDRAVIYMRVSTEKQTEKSQLEPCIQFCNDKGYSIIADPFVDHAKSAYHNVHRPKYEEVLKLVKEREIEHIVVWALDRWTRKGAKELKNSIEYLRCYNVQLHSVQEQWLESINIEGGMGDIISDFLFGLVAWMGKQESELKSQRVKNSERFQKAVDNNKVGRPKIPDSVRNKVIEFLKAGKSYNYIRDNVTYKAKFGKVRHVSIFTISQIKSSFEKGN